MITYQPCVGGAPWECHLRLGRWERSAMGASHIDGLGDRELSFRALFPPLRGPVTLEVWHNSSRSVQVRLSSTSRRTRLPSRTGHSYYRVPLIINGSRAAKLDSNKRLIPPSGKEVLSRGKLLTWQLNFIKIPVILQLLTALFHSHTYKIGLVRWVTYEAFISLYLHTFGPSKPICKI